MALSERAHSLAAADGFGKGAATDTRVYKFPGDGKRPERVCFHHVLFVCGLRN
jgi:hypothetical protein